MEYWLCIWGTNAKKVWQQIGDSLAAAKACNNKKWTSLKTS